MKMLFRPYRPFQIRHSLACSTKHNLPNVYNVQQRRNFINQLSSISRIHRAQIGHDLKRVGMLVLLPPVLVASYITACGILGFVGAQVWLEYFAMRPGPIDHKYETDHTNPVGYGWEDPGDWSGGENGGTDPSFGMLARIAIRSAWLFNTWAGQMGQQNIYSQTPSSASYIQNALLGSTDRAHALAEQSLAWALDRIDKKYPDKPIPRSLLLRHADLLEHLATPSALSEARREVSAVYREMPRGSYERCRLALRLGGLCIAEGGKGEAVRFWREALAVQRSGEGGVYSPAEERLVADAYLQLSALYSTDSRLDEAKDIQAQAVRAIGSFSHKADSKGPEKTLHNLYLSHRVAVLGIHAAEVHYAQTRDARSTTSRLDRVALDAGRIAESLMIYPNAAEPTATERAITIKPNQLPTFQISAFYSDSSSLTTPATSLLRDARRAAMQALVLEGMLLETLEESDLGGAAASVAIRDHLLGTRSIPNDSISPQPDNLTLALAAYEQALGWAGTTLKAARALGIPEREVVQARMKYELLRRRIGKEQMILEGV